MHALTLTHTHTHSLTLTHTLTHTHTHTHVQDLDAAREPWVYLACGHVYSYHNWKANTEESNSARTCPLCRKVGTHTVQHMHHCVVLV